MRILNAYMLHGFPLREIFSIAALSGCDGISIEPTQLDDLALDSLAERYALNITSVGAFFLNESSELDCIELIRRNAAKAASYGIHRLCVVLAASDGIPPDRPYRLRLLHSIAMCASEYGVHLSIEPLHGSLHHVSTLTSLSEAVELIREAGLPRLSITLDTAHCFADDIGETNIEALASWTDSVHLADLTGTDQDWRDFPGEGRLPLTEIVFRLRGGGYRGDWELEVIRSDIADLPKETLRRKIEHSFAVTGGAVVCGEIALHVYMNTSGEARWEAGGGSGMIATQMGALRAQPILLGVCGDDAMGMWLSSVLRGFTPFEPCQMGRTTSVVTIRAGQLDSLSIRTGNVDTSLLSDQLLHLPDSHCYGYMPLFPGYEASLEVLSDRPSWQMIHDFGYYLWCGDADAITRKIAVIERAGFCALVNAKGMSRAAKETLGRRCLERGYRYAILTDRDRPVLLFSHYGNIEVPVNPIEYPTDTCGAGDCFTAGFLTALEWGKDMDAAVRTGIETARQKLQTIGIWRPEQCQRH